MHRKLHFDLHNSRVQQHMSPTLPPILACSSNCTHTDHHSAFNSRLTATRTVPAGLIPTPTPRRKTNATTHALCSRKLTGEWSGFVLAAVLHFLYFTHDCIHIYITYMMGSDLV